LIPTIRIAPAVDWKGHETPTPAPGFPENVLTGFLNKRGEALGRPVAVAFDDQGALLVADDVGNRIWRILPASL
jgi:glucose/arabinose dehydrogenase